MKKVRTYERETSIWVSELAMIAISLIGIVVAFVLAYGVDIYAYTYPSLHYVTDPITNTRVPQLIYITLRWSGFEVIPEATFAYSVFMFISFGFQVANQFVDLPVRNPQKWQFVISAVSFAVCLACILGSTIQLQVSVS